MGNRHAFLRWFGHQDWISFGFRNRLLRAFIKPDEIKPYEFEIDFFGMRYRGNLNNYIDWMVYFFGAYEKETLMFLRDLIGKQTAAAVFLDIGANIGIHSLYMSQHAAVVHAFEPYELVRSSLERNIALNRIGNITVHPVALGNKTEELQYFAPTGFNRGTGSFVESHEARNNKALRKLHVEAADQYLAAHDIERIDLIKIDVEGFEKFVLAGLKNTLEKTRPAIFMEYSESTRNSLESEAELMGLLPDNYCIRKFNFTNNSYWLSEFNFNESGGDLILAPSQV
jgi:FkbM family methyltransferase